jgi:hypothetical protein
MNERSVSVAPDEQATPVDDPQIAEILDLTTGTSLDVKAFILSLRYDEAVIHRGEIREGLETEEPLYACAYCGVPVRLISQLAHRRFFFRHILEDGRCDARTRGYLSQEEIRARQYQGLREGAAHKRVKGLIERSLRSDPQFQSVAVETTWRAAHDPRQRRQPDVSATYEPFGRVAFEAQLSRTFLDVVVARRVFYRNEGALLVWILGHFEPDYRRLMVDDLLFSNNSNIFVVDDETTRISEERRALHVWCHFRRAYRDGFEVKEQWSEEIIAFADLTLDADGQRAFWVDFTGDEKRLRAEVEDNLRREFFDLLEMEWPHTDPHSAAHARWSALKSIFAARDIDLPGHYPQYHSGFRALIIAVRSMELGHPFLWKHTKLISVAHQIVNDHKDHVVAMVEAIRIFGRKKLLLDEDRKQRWADKRVEIKKSLDDLDGTYLPNTDWLPILRFLYPAVADAVQACNDRYVEMIT